MKIKKNQKFTITNVIPDWESMGITQRENNENKGVDHPMVINGKLYGYDERYCKENEVVRMSWTSMTDKEDWEISEDFLGYCEVLVHTILSRLFKASHKRTSAKCVSHPHRCFTAYVASVSETSSW